MASKKSLFSKIFNNTPGPYKRASGGGNIFATPDKAPAGMKAELAQYDSVGTLFAIVEGTSSAVSQVEWKLYRKAKPGQRKEDRVQVYSHQALNVWNQPNQFMTQQEFVQQIQQHIDLVGESYWFVSSVSLRGVSIPVELWPIRPDKCAPVPHPTKFLAGYVVTDPDGNKIPYNTEQIIQLLNPDPCDPYHGTSPVKSIMTDLNSTRYAAEWNMNFFKNGAEPGGIVEVPERLTDEEFEELNMRWREQHQGVSNAHRVAFLEAGTWKERKFSQRDMQFSELRGVNREIIREAYRFPKAMLGTTEDVNKAVAEAAETQFARWLVQPRLERIKQALNHHFLPLFYSDGALVDVEFDYDNPVPDDRQADNEQLTARTDAYVSLVGAGVDADDAAKVTGLPPMKYEKPEPPAPAPLAPPGDEKTPQEDSQPKEASNG